MSPPAPTPSQEGARTRALSALEEALDRWRPGWDDDEDVVVRARAISAHYTAPNASRQTPPADALTRAAYLAYFGPRAIGAVTSVFAPFLGSAERPPVVEIGAGTGASSLALAALGVERLTLVDRDPSALDAASALVASLGPTAETRVASKLDALAVGAEQVVVLSFALAEMVDAVGGEESDAERELLEALAGIAERAAGLVIVDAGDRVGGRTLQRFRALALERELAIHAPCPHDDDCPALARRRDWCHTRIPRALPDRFAKVADAIGRDPAWLAFSYLIVGAARATGQRPGGLRVIGEARKEKGRVRLPVCGAGGVRFLQALKRDREAFRALLETERGSLLGAPATEPRGDTLHTSALLETVDGDGYP